MRFKVRVTTVPYDYQTAEPRENFTVIFAEGIVTAKTILKVAKEQYTSSGTVVHDAEIVAYTEFCEGSPTS